MKHYSTPENFTNSGRCSKNKKMAACSMFRAPCSMDEGFTLLESLVVIGILAMITVFAFTSLGRFKRQSNLDSTSADILGVLRLARSKTLSSVDASNYGVHFESATYTLFTGRNYTEGNPANLSVPLPTDIGIASIALSTSTQSVVFERLTGFTTTTGSIHIADIDDMVHMRSITVYDSGESALSATGVPPADTRLADTRHVHFALNWTIANAATLRLRFYDPPNPNVVNDITMLPEPPRTSFAWEGDTMVGVENQHMSVQAHSIGIADTILSVQRNGDDNTKAVDISIIDGIEKAIASFSAQGAITVGAYGNIMTVQ